MKKLSSAAFLLFLFSLAGFAQENPAIREVYKGGTDEFTAEFPSQVRSSRITGLTTKRELFPADSSIATVTPIKKLPFGPTEQAIAAVKESSFATALRDGEPDSVFKPVLYTFSIK